MCFVHEILQRKPGEVWTIGPHETAYRALEVMSTRNVGALPVVEDGKVIGVFSERDYARKVILKDRSSRATTVSDLMSSPVQTVTPDTDIERCVELMTDKHIRHLPVIDDGHLVGIISIGDVVKARMHEQKVMIQDLTDFISGHRG